MENTLLTGLYVSIISMAVTFVALGILIGVMFLLLRVFPDKSEAEKSKDENEQTSTEKEIETDPKENEQLAVAMAVGMALLDHQDAFKSKDPNLGKLLE